MKPSIPILYAAIILGGAVRAQEPAPAFEVASVKPSTPQSVRNFSGGPGSRDPGMISYSRANLLDLLVRAYNLDDFEQVSGPDWLAMEPYDIVAKIPAGATKEQFRTMLRGLLAERYKLAFHHETRDFPVYELAIAKNGPKLKESVAGALAPERAGFPPLPADRPALRMTFRGNTARLAAHQQTLVQLASMLRQSAGRQILDKTGLSGTYDFTLEFAPRESTGPVSDDDALPNLFTALRQQLGLRLDPKKAAFDVIVVDHAERVPAGN